MLEGHNAHRSLAACCGWLIETPVQVLDEIGGDPDLEPTMGCQGHPYQGNAAADKCESPQDGKPELGWTGRMDQMQLGSAGDGRELDPCDDEPSLGSLDYEGSE